MKSCNTYHKHLWKYKPPCGREINEIMISDSFFILFSLKTLCLLSSLIFKKIIGYRSIKMELKEKSKQGKLQICPLYFFFQKIPYHSTRFSECWIYSLRCFCHRPKRCATNNTMNEFDNQNKSFKMFEKQTSFFVFVYMPWRRGDHDFLWLPILWSLKQYMSLYYPSPSLFLHSFVQGR